MVSMNHVNMDRNAESASSVGIQNPLNGIQNPLNGIQNPLNGTLHRFVRGQEERKNSIAPMGPKFAPALTEDDAVTQARLLKALADPTRLRILSLLSRHEGEVCVFEIVESFTLEQPTISHHLRILRDAGLVDCRKKGLWAYYYVRRESLSRAQDMINALV